MTNEEIAAYFEADTAIRKRMEEIKHIAFNADYITSSVYQWANVECFTLDTRNIGGRESGPWINMHFVDHNPGDCNWGSSGSIDRETFDIPQRLLTMTDDDIRTYFVTEKKKNDEAIQEHQRKQRELWQAQQTKERKKEYNRLKKEFGP